MGREVCWYYESGEIQSEGNYKEGKQDGQFVEYYESGKIKWEGNYKEGDGKYVGYDEDGNITDEDIYENGVCVEMCEGDE